MKLSTFSGKFYNGYFPFDRLFGNSCLRMDMFTDWLTYNAPRREVAIVTHILTIRVIQTGMDQNTSHLVIVKLY